MDLKTFYGKCKTQVIIFPPEDNLSNADLSKKDKNENAITEFATENDEYEENVLRLGRNNLLPAIVIPEADREENN